MPPTQTETVVNGRQANAKDSESDVLKVRNPATRMLIRPFKPEDLSDVRTLIANGIMELSRDANMHALWHPLAWGAWVLMTATLIQLGALRPTYVWDIGMAIVAACASAIVIMVATEYYHLSVFQGEVKRVLKDRDVVDIQTYYGGKAGQSHHKRPLGGEKSAFFVLQLGNEIIGCIGLDASHDPTSTVSDFQSTSTSTSEAEQNSARIRRFVVKKKQRGMGLGKDLLRKAMLHAKAANIHNVIAGTSALQSRASRLFIRSGFKNVSSGPQQKVGIYGVDRGEVEISVEDYFVHQGEK